MNTTNYKYYFNYKYFFQILFAAIIYYLLFFYFSLNKNKNKKNIIMEAFTIVMYNCMYCGFNKM